MKSIFENDLFNIILLLTIIGEFVIPMILKRYYPGYNSKTTVMSVLGNPKSPVKNIYNIWLIWLGLYLTIVAFKLFDQLKTFSLFLAILTLILVLSFAVGAGILSGLFSVNETKTMNTAAAKIHGFGAAIGFMSLLFFPLLTSIIEFRFNNYLLCIIYVIDFIITLIFFTLFIMADKDKFKGTIIAYEGLWQRCSLLAMYFPFIYLSITQIF